MSINAVKCLSYEGDLTAEGVKQGHGRCTTELGAKYVGSWFSDAFDGNGTLSLPNGNVYEGEFRGGVMHGRGRMGWATGVSYEGELHEGQVTGKGRMMTPEGTYEGEFLSGKYDGQGAMMYKDGTSYEGQWKTSIQSGAGTFTDTSNVKSTGTFVKGQKSGRFTVDKPSGSRYAEIWDKGELVSSLRVKESPNSIWGRLKGAKDVVPARRGSSKYEGFQDEDTENKFDKAFKRRGTTS